MTEAFKRYLGTWFNVLLNQNYIDKCFSDKENTRMVCFIKVHVFEIDNSKNNKNNKQYIYVCVYMDFSLYSE